MNNWVVSQFGKKFAVVFFVGNGHLLRDCFTENQKQAGGKEDERPSALGQVEIAHRVQGVGKATGEYQIIYVK